MGKNPLANSMAQGSKNPGTSHMDQRGAKLYEIYSSGKSSGGMHGHIASNISNGSGGSASHQNSFLQNKYQFATYYGQKNYPSSGQQMGVIGSSPQMNPHMQYNGQQMVNVGNGQYEYSIDGQVEGTRTGGTVPQTTLSSGNGGQNLPKTGSIGSKSSNQGGQNVVNSNSVPKRAPHSELTSYQSEKRLKEYKQQQAQL